MLFLLQIAIVRSELIFISQILELFSIGANLLTGIKFRGFSERISCDTS
jgi:hypothetical protein